MRYLGGKARIAKKINIIFTISKKNRATIC